MERFQASWSIDRRCGVVIAAPHLGLLILATAYGVWNGFWPAEPLQLTVFANWAVIFGLVAVQAGVKSREFDRGVRFAMLTVQLTMLELAAWWLIGRLPLSLGGCLYYLVALAAAVHIVLTFLHHMLGRRRREGPISFAGRLSPLANEAIFWLALVVIGYAVMVMPFGGPNRLPPAVWSFIGLLFPLMDRTGRLFGSKESPRRGVLFASIFSLWMVLMLRPWSPWPLSLPQLIFDAVIIAVFSLLGFATGLVRIDRPAAESTNLHDGPLDGPFDLFRSTDREFPSRGDG